MSGWRSLWLFFLLGIVTTARAESIFDFAATSDEVELSIPANLPREHDWEALLRRRELKDFRIEVRLHGPSPYARDSDTLFIPASNTKLFTAGLALERLGRDYQFETRIEWHRLDTRDATKVTQLTLVGSGDPTWGLPELGETLSTRVDRLADQLYLQGVREIHGEIKLRASDQRWNSLSYPAGWTQEEKTQCYGALPQAFNLDINCAAYIVRGVGRGRWADKGVATPVELALRSGEETKLYVAPVENQNGVSVGFRVTGTWKQGSQAKQLILPINDVGAWVRNLFIESLKKKGIRIVTEPPDRWNAKAYSTRHYSPELEQVLKPFLKQSINVIGDALFKYMGQKFGGANEDLWQAGQSVMSRYISNLGTLTARAQRIRPTYGYFAKRVSLVDGSGISRESSVTTGAVMTLLQDLKVRDDFDVIWGALPIAGKDGTLVYRMRNTAAHQVLRAKTGTLRGVYNLSGYVPKYGAKGEILEYFPFVILSKTTQKYKAAARSAQDRVGAALAEIVNAKVNARRLAIEDDAPAEGCLRIFDETCDAIPQP
ncbi:MAG: D-alanyl-D-alanine carboxypeptidase/D-alanyl-D-alanine-endopeptidase [Bdellovibrionota bacterium]